MNNLSKFTKYSISCIRITGARSYACFYVDNDSGNTIAIDSVDLPDRGDYTVVQGEGFTSYCSSHY